MAFHSTHFDLELYLSTEGEAWSGFFGYNSDLFAAGTIERMIGHYQVLLDRMLADPERPVSDVPMLTLSEQRQLTVEWNDTRSGHRPDKCIHELFEQQVEARPDATAVVFGSKRLTYRELNARADQLAHHLQTLGVGSEGLVGVCMDRSLDMVVALLGILKAGGAYVPIDPLYPKERLDFLVQDTALGVLVTEKQWLSRLPRHQAKVITLDHLFFSANNNGNRTGKATPESLAYIIYTSGSTGRPKGVAIEHRNAAALIAWARQVYAAEELAGVLASTSICFDLSVFELFVPLTLGGTVILTENILHLPGLPAADPVTLVNTVPSALAELLRAGGIPPSVVTVNLAGEPLKASLVRQIYAQGSIQRVYDLYGPSEDTTYSTCALRRPDGVETIGRPILNKEAYILNERRQPVPIGVRGELYLGGDGVARGYFNRPDLTAQKFVPNPFRSRPGARLYRTGDICRYLPDGNIEFLGRLDQQVKVRGFRIELGEIETVLGQHPGVEQCVVLAREDQPGQKQLVAYIVPAASNAAAGPEQLRDYLKQKLPQHMVPAAFVILERLPLTPNGKIDRNALSPPDRHRLTTGATMVAQRNPVERQLTEIWEEVLQVQPIRVTDNFFELGGHSLLAVRLTAEVEKNFGVRLPLATIFRTPRLEGLACAIQNAGEPETQAAAWSDFSCEPNNARRAIFWAPSVGTVERFVECHNIVRLLEQEYDSYGFDPLPQFGDIGSLAEHCVRLIRAKKPHGPYALAGYCQSGHVAHQIAQRLESDGEKVDLLVLIDCSARDLAPNFWQRVYSAPRRLARFVPARLPGARGRQLRDGCRDKMILRLRPRNLKIRFPRT